MITDESVRPNAWGVAHGLQWGIDPPSAWRRLGRRVLVWVPVAVYATISMIFFFCLPWDIGGPFIAMSCAGTAYLVVLALMPIPRVMRREGRIDLLLAGLRGRELLWAAAKPVILGAAILVALHVLQTAIIFMAVGRDYSDELFGNDPGPWLVINFAPVLPLLMGSGIAPCMWVIAKHPLTRIITIAVVVMVTLFAQIIFFAPYGVLLIIPALFMKEMYLAAIRRLERVD